MFHTAKEESNLFKSSLRLVTGSEVCKEERRLVIWAASPLCLRSLADDEEHAPVPRLAEGNLQGG